MEAMDVSSSSRKPHPELVNPNLDTNNQTSEVPVLKQQTLPWWSMPENQTKVTKEEVGERGQITCSWKSEAAAAFLAGISGARHLPNIRSILSKINTVDNLFSFPDERSCEVISKDTELLRTGTQDLNPCLSVLEPEISHNTAWPG